MKGPLRIGVIGLGQRGSDAVRVLSLLKGVEVTALCDIHPERVALRQRWLRENRKFTSPLEFSGAEGWKALCEADVDLVYSATPWSLHVPIALYAMECGKHVASEVPAAFTIDDCWRLVETSERTKRQCIQLENCVYGEVELLTERMIREGLFGELKHAECAYIHDLREWCYQDFKMSETDYCKTGYWNDWRLKWDAAHKGNQYPTHGLMPVCRYLNVNRGDRLDYLVSLECDQFGFEEYGSLRDKNRKRARTKVAMGDMNTTLVRTVKGRSILIQHDVSSPRPYSRINLLSGTRGTLKDYPLEIALAKAPGAPAHKWMDKAETERIKKRYMHPLWKEAGKYAKLVGGHGGMDFLMILRLCRALKRGELFDQDVYDLATTCSICELSERSVRNHSAPQDIPDWTRGKWKRRTPNEIGLADIKNFCQL